MSELIKQKKVDITLQNEITTYLNYSLPLCQLLTNKNKYYWLYEHFTSFYLMRNKNDYIWMDYLESLDFLQDVVESSVSDIFTLKNEKNILELIKNSIDNDYCVMIFADPYDLCETFHYKTHYIRGCFIYGYDDENSIFYGIGLMKNGNFGLLKYKYENILSGVKALLETDKEMMNWVYQRFMIRTKIKNPTSKYKFNVDVFKKELTNFVNSNGSKELLRKEIIVARGDKAIYGIAAQESFIEAFKELLEGKYILDYRFIHLLAEHKKLMLKKLSYTVELLNINSAQDILNDYANLVMSFEKIRRIFIKNVLADNKNNIYGCLKNKKVIEDLYTQLKQCTSTEKEIYYQFIELF